ncbi:MAG TPA: hypothetical protein VHM23_27340 [Actinomycetota bacterium]|jgi:hypothetical protein|nr:hypothetical protein [Actinomycetota bacterium]
MDRNELIAYTADCVLEHGGDLEAIFAVLRSQLAGTEIAIENDDLGQGELFALCALYVFQEVEGGADQLRRIRDRHRPLTVKAPRRSRWGWRDWGAR